MRKIKILLLINWRIKYLKYEDASLQLSDQCFNNKFWFFKYFKSDVDVDVVDTRSIKAIESFEKNKLRFYIMQTLRVLPRLNDYDLIISHGTTSGIFLDLLHQVFKFKMPPHIVVDISSFKQASTKGLAFHLCNYASRSINYLIYHTPIQSKYFDDFFPWLKNHKSFVPFGVDGNYWKKKQGENDGNGNYIVSVGYRRRDWRTLINAYNKSNQKYKLLLIGNDNIYVDNPNIRVLPFVDINRLINYICASKFCILPLNYLPFSYGQMTLLQQMALGKAIIAADVPSIQPYKSRGLKRYQAGNVKELTEKLNKMFDLNSGELKILGSINQTSVLNEYSEQNMAHDIEKVCKSILKDEGK